MEASRLVSKLRFSHLRLIVALQEAGSLRRAARTLHLTQSALSKALKEIETASGAQLYQRLPGRLSITPAGEALFRAARVLLAELEQVQLEVTAISAGGFPTIRLGATPFLAQTLVPEALAELRTGRAAFDIELTEGPVPGLISKLCEGRLDAALTAWQPTSRIAVTERLATDVLRPESLLVIAHPASPLAGRKLIHWADLADEPWILPGPSSLLRQIVDSAFIAQGLRPPPVAIGSMSPATNVALVAQGLGVAALPGTAIMTAERSGIVRRLPLRPAMPLAPVTLVYRHSFGASEKIDAIRRATHAVIDRIGPQTD